MENFRLYNSCKLTRGIEMKYMMEKVTIVVIALLLLGIVAMIVQYNLIDDGDSSGYTVSETTLEAPAVELKVKKAKTSNYLQNLESYTDVDVKVDPTKANNANRVEVISELARDDIGLAVANTDQSTYVDNLKDYADKKDSDTADKTKSKKELEEDKKEDDKVKLDQDEIEDDIGNAIGDVLGDI